jgi:UDP-N-acetyl-D-mannosaminuronic acid dehydrogenase
VFLSKWNAKILEPRDGIGGHCIPKDTKMFINSSDIIKSKTPPAAIEIDEDSRAYDLANTQPNTQGKHEMS